jgi:hypothetical protein
MELKICGSLNGALCPPHRDNKAVGEDHGALAFCHGINILLHPAKVNAMRVLSSGDRRTTNDTLS